MANRILLTISILTTTLLTDANAYDTNGNNHIKNKINRGEERFQLCRPYEMIKIELSNKLDNFESQIVAPIRKNLEDQRNNISQRQANEQKLELVLRSTQESIINNERRLGEIPKLIADAQNSIKASQDSLPGLEQQSANLQKEFDAANGWFARAAVKIKISNMNSRIDDTKNNIQNKGRDIANMQSESLRLPGQIAKSKADVITAGINLDQLRNQRPTLSEMLDREQQIRNQLDSQGEMRNRLTENLNNSKDDLDLCIKIDEDAATYKELGVMASRLRTEKCNIENVRNRLPYDATDAEKRALEQANHLVCSPN